MDDADPIGKTLADRECKCKHSKNVNLFEKRLVEKRSVEVPPVRVYFHKTFRVN